MYRNIHGNVNPNSDGNAIYDRWWFQIWALVLFTYIATIFINCRMGAEFNLHHLITFLGIMGTFAGVRLWVDCKRKKH